MTTLQEFLPVMKELLIVCLGFIKQDGINIPIALVIDFQMYW